MCCGTLEYYDKAYDRVNVKHEKALQRIDRIFHTVSYSNLRLYVNGSKFIMFLTLWSTITYFTKQGIY